MGVYPLRRSTPTTGCFLTNYKSKAVRDYRQGLKDLKERETTIRDLESKIRQAENTLSKAATLGCRNTSVNEEFINFMYR